MKNIPSSAASGRIHLAALATLLLSTAAQTAPRDVVYTPLAMESVVVNAQRHAVSIGAELAMDQFNARLGTETFKGIFSRAQPALEYRYAPADNVEVLFQGLFTSQAATFTDGNGKEVAKRSSQGFGQPQVGIKLKLASWAAGMLTTAPPTERLRDPRLGDGTHYGSTLLFKAGRWHFSVGHTVRLPYAVEGSTQTHRWNRGDVTELALGLTKRDDLGFNKRDFVGPVLELHGVYFDRDRLDGNPVKGSAGMTGKVLFGFVLGKINSDAIHLTQVALSGGFGRGLHSTEDPSFGVGDLQLLLRYSLRWGDRT